MEIELLSNNSYGETCSRRKQNRVALPGIIDSRYVREITGNPKALTRTRRSRVSSDNYGRQDRLSHSGNDGQCSVFILNGFYNKYICFSFLYCSNMNK